MFYDILDELSSNDVFVMNNIKVIFVRLVGEKIDIYVVIEVLLFKELEKNIWEVLMKFVKKIKIGIVVSFGDGVFKMECIGIKDEGICIFKVIYEGIFLEVLDVLGIMLLLFYIMEKLEDKLRY